MRYSRRLVIGNKNGVPRDPIALLPDLQACAYGRVPVGKGQAAAGFNAVCVGAAGFLAAGFFTAEPAFFLAAGLLTFFLQQACA
jgi:hypothetical protein